MSNDESVATESQESKSWVVLVSADFIDESMSDQAWRLLFKLESMARAHSWCFPGNDHLAKALGKRTSTIRESLGELERLGWIHRAYADPQKRNRIGIVMRRRLDPRMPRAATKAEIAVAVAEIVVAGKSATTVVDTARCRNSGTEVVPSNESSITHAHARDSMPSGTSSAVAAHFACGDYAPHSEIAWSHDAPEGQQAHAAQPPKAETRSGGGAGEPTVDGDFTDDPDTAFLFAKAANGVRTIHSLSSRSRFVGGAIADTLGHVVELMQDDHSRGGWRNVLKGVRDHVYDPEWVIESWRRGLIGLRDGRIGVLGAYSYSLVHRGPIENLDQRMAEEQQDQRVAS